MAALVCGLWACTDGLGMPFLPVLEAGSGSFGQAGSAAGQTPAGRGAAAGRGGAGVGGSGGDRRVSRDCQQGWPSSSVREEQRLIDLFDEMRGTANNGVCPVTWWIPAFERDDGFECVARMRFAQAGPSRNVTGPPSYSTRTTFPPGDVDGELRDRVVWAGVSGGVIELTVIGALSSKDVLSGIPGAPNRDEICQLLTRTSVIGVAHMESTWIVDFRWPTMNSPAHSGPPMPGDH